MGDINERYTVQEEVEVAFCMPLSLDNDKQLEIFTIVIPEDHTCPHTTGDLEVNTQAAY